MQQIADQNANKTLNQHVLEYLFYQEQTNGVNLPNSTFTQPIVFIKMLNDFITKIILLPESFVEKFYIFEIKQF